MTYPVTIDVGLKTQRTVQMTVEQFKAYSAQKSAAALAKFDADCRAAGLVNPLSQKGR